MTQVGDLRQMLVELSDDEKVTFVFETEETEYEFEVMKVQRTVEGDVDVRLRHDDLRREVDEINRREAWCDGLEVDATRFATALRLLRDDAGVDERDLDTVANSLDPVAVIARSRR